MKRRGRSYYPQGPLTAVVCSLCGWRGKRRIPSEGYPHTRAKVLDRECPQCKRYARVRIAS